MKLTALNLGNPSRDLVRSSTPANPTPRMLRVWGASPTASGADVSEDGALRCLAVFACIRIISETAAMLPLKVLERLTGGGKAPAENHPAWPVLHDEANPEQSSMGFRETLFGHLAGWGNGYAFEERTNAGQLKALWPLRPDRKWPERLADKRLVYHTTLPDGSTRVIQASEVLHVRTLSGDGLRGYSPIAQVRESVGLALATEQFGSRFFGQGALPGFVFKHPGLMGDDAKKDLTTSWREQHEGFTRSHAIAVLEEGMGIEKIGIPPEDAQFLETRQFQDRQIAKLYRIPLHMLADMDKGSGFSSVEQLGLEFVVFSMMPWLVRFEQEANRTLLTPAERGRFFVKHNVAGLLRGDLKSRYMAYAVGRQWGWLSADDIRELEDMNPLPNGQGNIYLTPMNMAPASSASVRRVSRQVRLLRRLVEHSNGNGNGRAAVGAS